MQLSLPEGQRLAPAWVESELEELATSGLQRTRVPLVRPRPGWLTVDGTDYLDFASNDYLGLAGDPRIAMAVRDFLATAGWGAAASPLITGYHPAHEQLEKNLAEFEGVERVLLFGSGFVANFGVLSAIAGPEDILLSEERNHASLIDGCRLSKARIVRYRSDRLGELAAQLRQAASYRRRVIVTDSVFSMDGDIAPLADLCDLADQHEAILYVDEAHGTGMLGANGRGAAEHLGVEKRIPLRMGTLSKALGSVGGFVATNEPWGEWLLHKARPYVYSTALPPACAVAANAALEILRGEPQRRHRLHQHATWLRQALGEVGINTEPSTTAIIPIPLRTPERALEVAGKLRDEGLWVGAIRPPTVPIGTSRLRVSLSAAHETAEIGRLFETLRKAICGKDLG